MTKGQPPWRRRRFRAYFRVPSVLRGKTIVPPHRHTFLPQGPNEAVGDLEVFFLITEKDIRQLFTFLYFIARVAVLCYFRANFNRRLVETYGR